MNGLEIIGTLVGLLYLYFEYKSSIYLWITAIVMPAIYIAVYYNAGLYADFGINIYYLFAAIIGWIYWLHKQDKHEDKKFPITRTPLKYYALFTFVFFVSFAAISWLLINHTDSDVPVLDSFTTALSIIGMWMLTKKYVEQWITWILVDIVSAGLYIYKELYFTAGLYAIYTVIAIFGYINWVKLMKNDAK